MENNTNEMMAFDVISLFKDEVQMSEEDLYAMEFALEEYYEERIAENILYFNQSPEKLKEANGYITQELNDLNAEFVDKEMFEKCSVVTKVLTVIQSKIDEVNISSEN